MVNLDERNRLLHTHLTTVRYNSHHVYPSLLYVLLVSLVSLALVERVQYSTRIAVVDLKLLDGAYDVVVTIQEATSQRAEYY